MSGSPKRNKFGAKIDHSKYDANRVYKKEQETFHEFKGWLCKSNRSSEEKAFCRWCQSEIQPNLAKLRIHAKTEKHKKEEKNKAIQKPLNKVFKPAGTTAKEVRQRRELRLALICSNNTSLQTIDDLSDFVTDEFGAGTVKIKRTKARALITHVLAPYFKDELKVILFFIYRFRYVFMSQNIFYPI